MQTTAPFASLFLLINKLYAVTITNDPGEDTPTQRINMCQVCVSTCMCDRLICPCSRLAPPPITWPLVLPTWLLNEHVLCIYASIPFLFNTQPVSVCSVHLEILNTANKVLSFWWGHPEFLPWAEEWVMVWGGGPLHVHWESNSPPPD